MPTISWVKLIHKQEFAKAVLNKNFETFVIYVATLKIPITILIYSSRTSQIYGFIYSTLVALQLDKALAKILANYSDYSDVFSSDLAMGLSKNIDINKYIIK